MSVTPPRLYTPDARETAARAEAIRAQVMAAPLQRLWRVALGTEIGTGTETAGAPAAGRPVGNTTMVAAPAPATPQPDPSADKAAIQQILPPADGALRLGANQAMAPAIENAALRTGLPAAALAAIIDAEAAKRKDGSWNAASRNPRSTAAGLTQFLSGSWIGEAERPGTFLNRIARANDWINSAGQIRVEARRALLSLRLDAGTAIEAAADYAKHNLAQLEKAGVEVGGGIARIARLAYLSHHLGAGDAVRYLKGGLDGARASVLLAAQVGATAARDKVEAIGDAAAAHRNWLESFVAKRISVGRFFG